MRRLLYALSLAAVVAAAAVVVSAQGPPPGSRAWVHIPDSTIERLTDIGFRAHTNHLILVRREGKPIKPSGPGGLWPSVLWKWYAGSDYSTGKTSGSNLIVIVDAYHYGTALNDFNVFSAQFGLPTEPSTSATASTNQVFQVVYATGKQPKANCGWGQEAALDIEWAHAMAPKAKIILVEAASASFADLFTAVDVATIYATGGGQVSMSWGGSEFSGETSYDSRFSGDHVVYIASSGDTGGVTIYPSVSPSVIAAGGTSVAHSGTGDAAVISGESGWSGSGGGPSAYEGIPDYQAAITEIVGTARGVPDFSFDADPYTGVPVYDSTSCQGYVGWMVFGGTSVSAPALAGLINSAGAFAATTGSQLSTAYAKTASFRDITTGSTKYYSATSGWDFVTGLGTPYATLGGLK
jgi:subtilase family serine protease